MAEEWDANITKEEAAGDVEGAETTEGGEDVLASGAHGDEHTVEETGTDESVPAAGEAVPVDVTSELPEPDEETTEASPGYAAPVPEAPPADAADGANSQSA